MNQSENKKEASVAVTTTGSRSCGLKTYPEDKVEEKNQELHTFHSSLHPAWYFDSEKRKKNKIYIYIYTYINYKAVWFLYIFNLVDLYCVTTNALTNQNIVQWLAVQFMICIHNKKNRKSTKMPDSHCSGFEQDLLILNCLDWTLLQL